MDVGYQKKDQKVTVEYTKVFGMFSTIHIEGTWVFSVLNFPAPICCYMLCEISITHSLTPLTYDVIGYFNKLKDVFPFL